MGNEERIEEIERKVMGISGIIAQYTAKILDELKKLNKHLAQLIEVIGEEKN